MKKLKEANKEFIRFKMVLYKDCYDTYKKEIYKGYTHNENMIMIRDYFQLYVYNYKISFAVSSIFEGNYYCGKSDGIIYSMRNTKSHKIDLSNFVCFKLIGRYDMKRLNKLIRINKIDLEEEFNSQFSSLICDEIIFRPVYTLYEINK